MATGRTSGKVVVKAGLLLLGLICVSLMLSQPVFAAQGISTDELVKSSEVVIAGKVEKSSCHWTKGTVITRATIKVSEVLVGNVDKKDIIVEYEGGKVGDLELMLKDMVTLTKGEEIILFLKAGQSRLAGTAYFIEGKAQGKYIIKNGIATKNGFTLETNHDVVDNNISVKDLTAKIRTNQ
ncbi:MAG: hypothetical protein HQL01_05875 [Nitrospirae bacterium]|nr:hypothetical protein [Nitrospirota bacterium]